MRNLFLLLMLVFLTPHYAFEHNEQEYQYLDNLAVANDASATSRKGSNGHNYTEVYSRYFATLRDKPLKFLEIGIFEGNGVKMWEAYFPNAQLHFVDITFDKVKYFSPRSQYHLADQGNPQQLQQLIQKIGGEFDLIIDDGGHTMQQQLVSFHELFPYVKSGGIYIIEDTHTSYWKTYGGNGTYENPKAGPHTFIHFAKGLIDEINYVGARTLSANHTKISPELEKQLTYYQKHIYSMHIYDSLCIIIKR